MTGRVITFYSYKGGVGRSFLLANVAVWMARVGFRVLCVDWDLEAPGLFHYFNENSLLRPGRRAGLVDLIPELTKGKRPDWKRLLRGTNLKDAKGSLDLLDAGDASSDEYGKQLGAIDWDGRYKSEVIQLGERIEELRREWIRDYDFVLLDSRTGLTDIGGICTAQLPDLVVLVLAPNTQGISGTLGALAKARKQRALLPLDRGDFMVLPVPSRFDPNAVGAELDKWTRVLAERLQPLYDEWRDKDTPVERLHALLRIPHVARWSLGEPLPVLLESADDPSSVSHAIETVAAFLACDLHGSKELVEERNRYVREVIVRNRSLLGVEPAAPTPFKYEVFLSFSRADRDYARAVAVELAARGRSVFFDEQAIESGTLWANALARALGEARSMAAVVGKEISSWQRSEVEAFADLARADSSRAVIPVLRHGNQPNWPELFAFQGAKIGAGSPAETASALHTALRQLETPKQTTHPKTALVLWTEPEALSAYRQWVADQHEKLIPYFDGAADLLLEETFVQVELEPTHSQEDLAQIEGLNRSESGSRLGPHALHEREGKLDTAILEDLLAPQARGPVAPRWPIVGESGAGKSALARSFARSREGKAGPRTLEDLLLPQERGPVAPRWLIVGEPGAGKTTLVRSLARSTAQERIQVPVFVPLAHVKSAFDPVEFALQEMLGIDTPHSPRAAVLRSALTNAAKRGELLLLLDGFDEVDPGRMDKLLAEIVAYAEANKFTSLAVTTRPIAIERRDIPTVFCRARVLALPSERQGELLSKLLGQHEASRVRAHIAQHPALADLAASPLLLTLIAVVARDTVLAETSLPNTRSRLYATAIDLLLRRGFGVEKQGVRDTGHARRLLQKLSLLLHTQGGECWERKALSESLTTLRRQDDEANFMLKETWVTNDAFLDDIGTNSGVFGPHDGPNAPWRYLHRSLREFLAAEEIARESAEQINTRVTNWARESDSWAQATLSSRINGGGKLDELTNPARWAEVFALLAGLLPDPTPLLDAICNSSAALAHRTLASIDALQPIDIVTRFVAIEGWEPHELDSMFSRWGLRISSRCELLWQVVSPDLSIEGLGRLWRMLELADQEPDRGLFFKRSGRSMPPPDFVKWVRIPAGDFMMGSEATDNSDELPVHLVSLSAFELALTPVTASQWLQFESLIPSFSIPTRPELPATGVSWYAARLFCSWLGARLPSEAEWEYACRAGTKTEYWFGDDEKQLGQFGWYADNSGNALQPVGGKLANPWGLFDMHGLVWEWCEDTEHDTYDGAPNDGTAWCSSSYKERISRGGSFRDSADSLRSACRMNFPDWFPIDIIGFRPARSVTVN